MGGLDEKRGGWMKSGGWEVNKSAIFRKFVLLVLLGGKKWGPKPSAPPGAPCLFQVEFCVVDNDR